MAPKKRKVIGTVLKSTRKVVEETVQVAVVDRDTQDSEDIQSNVDGLGNKEPPTQEEQQEQEEENVVLEDIINGDVLKKEQNVRVIPVEEKTTHEQVEVERDGQSVEVPLNEEEEEEEGGGGGGGGGESMRDDGSSLDSDREKSKEEERSGRVLKEMPRPRESDIGVAQEHDPSKQDQDLARASSEVTQEQEQEPEQQQEAEREQGSPREDRKMKRKERTTETQEGKEEDEAQENKRKRRRRTTPLHIRTASLGYKRYVFRVLKQVHPELRISSMAMTIINSLMNDMFDRIVDEASKLSRYVQRVTLSSSKIQDAVKLVLPGELGKHAIAEGSRALSNYVSYEGKKGST